MKLLSDMTPLRWFRAFYFTVFVLVAGVEFWAISRHGSGFTLSEWTWSKISTVPMRMAVGGLLIWLVWHFLFVGPNKGLGKWDLVFVGLGLAVGAAATKWGWY